MKLYVQIYLGSKHGREVTWQQIIEKLRILKENSRFKGVIVGWSEEPDLYNRLRKYTKEHGLELWLWLPLFSEFQYLKQFSPIFTIENNIVAGNPFDNDEEFSFYCPTQPQTILNIKKIYESLYASVKFDGIFLDRIRFPSMVSGLSSLFSCFCPECVSEYQLKGISYDELMYCFKSIQARIKDRDCENPLGILKYEQCTYSFENPVLDKYLKSRSNLITKSVSEISIFFKEQGLSIGMDLFAPCLAPFVGQDYYALSQFADFIKPMMYRFTDTPAGLGFEMRALVDAISTDLTRNVRYIFLSNVVGTNENNGHLELMKKELNTIRLLKENTEAYVGIETHTLQEKKPILPEQIKENLELISAYKLEGCVACWDIINTSVENLLVFNHVIKE